MFKPLCNLKYGILLIAITTQYACNQQSKNQSKHVNQSTENKRDGIREMMEQDFEMMKDPATGTVPLQRMLVAKAYKDKLVRSRAALSGMSWESLGAKNQGGRTRTMLIDANDVTGNTVFAASVGGGLWKTTDITAAEPNWFAVNDFLDNLAVTCIAQDPTNPAIMYIGTGEGYLNGDAIQGLGVWKSIDGGTTWNQLASTVGGDFNYCQKIAITSTGVLLVATKSGLQRSINGGTTFSKVLGSGMGITGAVSNFCYDIEIAANGDIYSSLNSSIHKSTNGGATFGAAQTTPITMSRVELACAPSDANYVYAVVELNSGVEGILRTTNGGTTWTSRTEPEDADSGIPATDFSRTQAWYDLSIAVDPNNRDVLFVGGIDLFKSTDGANTWSQVSHWYGGFGFQNVHADQHFALYANGSSSIAYFTNDGGIYRTTNANDAMPTIIDKGTNYITTQFYGCAMHPDAQTSHYLAGSQDNGTHLFTSNTLQNTTEVTGGDGAFCNIDQNESQYQFSQYVRNNYYRSTDGGASFTSVNHGNSGRFINPTDYDDVNNILYAARNNDQYLRWNNPQSGNSFTSVAVAAFGGNQVSAVKVSPNTNHRVFFGLGNGDLFRVDNANTGTPTATNISTGLPTGYLACVEVQTGDDNHILVTYSNFGLNSVWETTNGGTSWTSVEGNLPDMPIRWALFNPTNSDQAVLATELGVWSTDNLNGGSTVWGASNTGLANVRVDQLQIRTSDKYMIASTHGRGLFASDYFSDPLALFDADTRIGYIGSTIQFSNSSYKDVSWNWNFGDGNISTLQAPSHVYTTPGIYNVTLTINGGASTLTKNQYIHILPNRPTPYSLADGGNFEVNPFDFGADNAAGTPWERGNSAIAGKSGTLSASNAWVTGLTATTYGDNSDVRLMTPNFNMTTAGSYTLRFYRKNAFEIGWDGFRVEYTLDKGLTWTPLGAVTANWYDFANTTQNTAFNQNQPFFNGTKSSFSLCELNISSLAGNDNVAFRLRFKSDGNTTAAGVAIDNFELLGPPNGVLPLELTQFDVERKNDQAMINWTSLNELNVSHYELERSTDGKQFGKIYQVNANNQARNAYSYVDNLTSIEKAYPSVYYRLKMVDNTQQYKYSQVKQLRFTSEGIVAIGPNPFKQQLEIVTQDRILNVSLHTLLGKTVYQQRNPTSSTIQFGPGLANGTYILLVETNKRRFVQQVLKAD
jgi:PKD repeat protein